MLPAIRTVAIGDEILTGQISDTNSTFVAQHFFEAGYRISQQLVICDKEEEILVSLFESEKNWETAIYFGGLGPTTDDLTVDVVSKFLDCEPVIDPASEKRLREVYANRNRVVNEIALRQVRYPKRAQVFENSVGLAPAFGFKKGNCRFIFLPGVPNEMKTLFEKQIFPLLLKEFSRGNEVTRMEKRVWRCVGIPESELQTLLFPIESQLPSGFRVGYQTSYLENRVTLYVENKTKNYAEKMREVAAQMTKVLQPWIYGDGIQNLEEAVLEALIKNNYQLALAESCTGGAISSRLVRVAGMSKHLWGEFTCYQVPAKKKMLGIDLKNEDAAVSRATTEAMAKQCKEISGCDIAAAITGYLGPGGGTQENPVGTIYVAIQSKNNFFDKKIVLPRKNRTENQNAAVICLLFELWKFLTAEKNA